jgi:hypothetical protein
VGVMPEEPALLEDPATLEELAMPGEPKPPAPRALTAEALLSVLLEVFRERGVARLPTEELAAALAERGGWTITSTKLTRTLTPCGVRPRQYRVRGRRVWGYLAADLAAALDSGRAAEIHDAAPPRKAQGAGLSTESRGAKAPEPPVPAAPEIDLAQEWGLRLAMAAVRRW